MEERKRIEQHRYEEMARAQMRDSTLATGQGHAGAGAIIGASAIDAPLRRPYLEFERAVRAVTGRGAAVLDLGAGTGTHSFAASGLAALIVATDIAQGALQIARSRAATQAQDLAAVTADSERLPFSDASFDVVTSAGILYCHDLPALTAEVTRVLLPGGHWVIVDSFDHNPVYRLNRVIGRLRGTRTRLAVDNIPTTHTLDFLREHFASTQVSYYGVFVFAAPLLSRLVGRRIASQIIDRADALFPFLSRFAFKIVVIARRAT